MPAIVRVPLVTRLQVLVSRHDHAHDLKVCAVLLPATIQVETDKHQRAGTKWAEDDEAAFKKKITDRYDSEGSPFFASARLWGECGRG